MPGVIQSTAEVVVVALECSAQNTSSHAAQSFESAMKICSARPPPLVPRTAGFVHQVHAFRRHPSLAHRVSGMTTASADPTARIIVHDVVELRANVVDVVVAAHGIEQLLCAPRRCRHKLRLSSFVAKVPLRDRAVGGHSVSIDRASEGDEDGDVVAAA